MSAPTQEKTLRRGGNAAAESIAKERANRAKSNTYSLWEYFRLAEPEGTELYGESAVIRLIVDEPELVEVKAHPYIPTKKAPSDLPEGRNWPARRDATCRYTYDANGDTLFADCYICDVVKVKGSGKKADQMVSPFPATRLYGVAVIRKPVIGTAELVEAGKIEEFQIGSPVWYEDEMVEKEIDGKTVTIPHFVVLKFGLKNFWDKFLTFQDAYGTLVDRDYKVTRKGKSTETDYAIAPLEVQLDPETGKKFDLRNPIFKNRYEVPVNLTEIVMREASDEHYEWFYDTSVDSSYEKRFGKSDDKATDGGAESSAAPASSAENDAAQQEITQEMKENMRDRLRNAGKK